MINSKFLAKLTVTAAICLATAHLVYSLPAVSGVFCLMCGIVALRVVWYS